MTSKKGMFTFPSRMPPIKPLHQQLLLFFSFLQCNTQLALTCVSAPPKTLRKFSLLSSMVSSIWSPGALTQMNVWLYVLAVFMPGKSAVHTQKLQVLESNVLRREEGGPPPVYEMYDVDQFSYHHTYCHQRNFSSTTRSIQRHKILIILGISLTFPSQLPKCLKSYHSGKSVEVKPPRDWDPLVKQTYSVWVETEKGRRKWHLSKHPL